MFSGRHRLAASDGGMGRGENCTHWLRAKVCKNGKEAGITHIGLEPKCVKLISRDPLHRPISSKRQGRVLLACSQVIAVGSSGSPVTSIPMTLLLEDSLLHMAFPINPLAPVVKRFIAIGGLSVRLNQP